MRKVIGFLTGVAFVVALAWGMEASAQTNEYYEITQINANMDDESTLAWGAIVGCVITVPDGNGTGNATFSAAFVGQCASPPYGYVAKSGTRFNTGDGDQVRVSAIVEAVQPHLSDAQYTVEDNLGESLTVSTMDVYVTQITEPPEDSYCEKYAGTELSYNADATGGMVDKHGCECDPAGGYGVQITVNGVASDGVAGRCTLTGQEAGSGTAPPADDPAPEEKQEQGDNCATGESGRTICADPPPEENCGAYNGTRYCVTPEDQPQCLTGSNGTVVCQSDGTDYPPDAPTTDFGASKPPADEWGHTDTGGGSRPLGGWPDGGGSGDGSSGGSGDGGDGGTGGDGSVDMPGDENGDGICDPNVENCEEGDGPNLDEVCAEGVDCDAGAGMSDLLTTIQTQGIVAEATGLSLPSGGAACPPLAFDTEMTGALSTDVHCTIAADQAALISGAMRAVWVIAALFVLLSG